MALKEFYSGFLCQWEPLKSFQQRGDIVRFGFRKLTLILATVWGVWGTSGWKCTGESEIGEHVTGWRGGPFTRNSRARGLWEEHLTPTVFSVHPTGPFLWGLGSVPPLAKIHVPITFFGFSVHQPFPSLLYFSKVRLHLETSSKIGLHTSEQRAQCPPIRMNSSDLLHLVIGASKSLKFWSWGNRLLWTNMLESTFLLGLKAFRAPWVRWKAVWFLRLISWLPPRSVGQSCGCNSSDSQVIGMEVEKHRRVAWVWPQCQKETNYCEEVGGSFPVPSSPSGFFLKPALRLKSHFPNLVREGGRKSGCYIRTNVFKV